MAQSEPRAPVVSGHRLGGQGRPQQPTGWAAVMRLGWWQFGAPTSCLRHSGVYPPPGGQLLCPTGPGARKGGPGRSLLHQADLEGPRGAEGQWPAIPASATAGPGPFQESSEALGLKAVPLLGVRSCGNRDPDPGGSLGGGWVWAGPRAAGLVGPGRGRRMRMLGREAWCSLTWQSGSGKRPPQRRCGPWPSCRGLQLSLWAQNLLIPGQCETQAPAPACTAYPGRCLSCLCYILMTPQPAGHDTPDRPSHGATCVQGPLLGSQAEITV